MKKIEFLNYCQIPFNRGFKYQELSMAAALNSLLSEFNHYGYESESIEVAPDDAEHGYTEAIQFTTTELVSKWGQANSFNLSFTLNYPYTIKIMRELNGRCCMIINGKDDNWSQNSTQFYQSIDNVVRALSNHDVKPNPTLLSKGVQDG